MKYRELSVAYYELTYKPKTRDKEVAAPSGASAGEIIEAATKLIELQGVTPHLNSRGSTRITISDWQKGTSGDEYLLLINRSDQDRPDVALHHFDTDAVRRAGKTKEEGISISSHILVRIRPGNPSALLLVTQGGGCNAQVLERIFGAVCRHLRASGTAKNCFKFAHPSGAAGKTYDVTYEVECVGFKGSTLAEDLERGQLKDVELIINETAKFDSGGTFVQHSRSISIAPTIDNVRFGKFMAALSDQISRHKFDEARVRFKNPDGHLRTETFSVNELEAAFIKRDYIKLDSDIDSHYTAVSQDIVNKMRKLLN